VELGDSAPDGRVLRIEQSGKGLRGDVELTGKSGQRLRLQLVAHRLDGVHVRTRNGGALLSERRAESTCQVIDRLRALAPPADRAYYLYVTDADGRDGILTKGSVVAGNEAIHRGLLKLLKTAGAETDLAATPAD
jgi:hypothetical protein